MRDQSITSIIHNSTGLYTLFLHLYVTMYDVTCDVTLSLLVSHNVTYFPSYK